MGIKSEMIQEIIITQEYIDNHSKKFKHPLPLNCKGCYNLIKAGERVLYIERQAFYVHNTVFCIGLLKNRHNKLYKYSGLRKRFEGIQSAPVQDSDTDERDKHLYDTPSTSRRL
jgi:hypothetical protein